MPSPSSTTTVEPAEVLASYPEVVPFVDLDRVRRYGVVVNRYWTSDGEPFDSKWIGTYDTRIQAEAAMLSAWITECRS